MFLTKQQYDPEISEDEEIIDSEEDNSDKIALEQPKPKGAHDLQAAQYSFSNADNLETYERLGREKGKVCRFPSHRPLRGEPDICA